MSCSDREFERWKRQSERRMDQSKKGGVDADIAGLVRLLNGLDQYFTTSSCSGRVILIDGSAESCDVQKQNCQWLFVSHQKCTTEELVEALGRSSGDAVLKFEPFVLHVQCRRLDDAQLMHSVAVNSGFRNSGLTVGKTRKIISRADFFACNFSQYGIKLILHIFNYRLFYCSKSTFQSASEQQKQHSYREWARLSTDLACKFA